MPKLPMTTFLSHFNPPVVLEQSDQLPYRNGHGAPTNKTRRFDTPITACQWYPIEDCSAASWKATASPANGRSASAIGRAILGIFSALGAVYRRHAGVCLETGHLPDSVNRPEFPSTILRPGATYRETCIYRFGAR